MMQNTSITLQLFMSLYKNDFPLKINLYSRVKVGNLDTRAYLGKFTIEDHKCADIDMETMIVESFDISSEGEDDMLNIFVRDNPDVHKRETTTRDVTDNDPKPFVNKLYYTDTTELQR